MEPRYNETLYNEVLRITNDFLYPSNSKIREKEPRNLVIANKFCQSLGPSFYGSRFHCTLVSLFKPLPGRIVLLSQTY